MRLVKAKKTLFYDGFRRREGDVFEWNGTITDAVELVFDGEEMPLDENLQIATGDGINLSDDELRVRLAEYGVKVHPRAGRTKMLGLLAEAEGKVSEQSEEGS